MPSGARRSVCVMLWVSLSRPPGIAVFAARHPLIYTTPAAAYGTACRSRTHAAPLLAVRSAFSVPFSRPAMQHIKTPGSQMTTRRALRRQRPCCPQSAWPAAALPNLPAGRHGTTNQGGKPQPRAVMSTTKPGISTGHRHLIATTRNMQRAGTMWPGGFCVS